MESWREGIDRSRERRAEGSSQDNHAPLIERAPVTGQAGGVRQHSIVDGAGGEQMTVAGQDEGASTASPSTLLTIRGHNKMARKLHLLL
ncbi:hypothetical protein GN958_ATG05850 [Phytophthora infestans]|uniref:Uncharacterized protein n=1 Tax=Phytophthora infestans TaxID=4787 RepID=A0A8S9UW76_PHYIN|nr:hypothetical protein GN958_ATG05850 [Phytophthora infestans]